MEFSRSFVAWVTVFSPAVARSFNVICSSALTAGSDMKKAPVDLHWSLSMATPGNYAGNVSRLINAGTTQTYGLPSLPRSLPTQTTRPEAAPSRNASPDAAPLQQGRRRSGLWNVFFVSLRLDQLG